MGVPLFQEIKGYMFTYDQKDPDVTDQQYKDNKYATFLWLKTNEVTPPGGNVDLATSYQPLNDTKAANLDNEYIFYTTSTIPDDVKVRYHIVMTSDFNNMVKDYLMNKWDM